MVLFKATLLTLWAQVTTASANVCKQQHLYICPTPNASIWAHRLTINPSSPP